MGGATVDEVNFVMRDKDGNIDYKYVTLMWQ